MSFILFIFCGVVISQATAARKCDNLGVLVYDDMKCKPNFDGPGSCPSSYTCPDIIRSENKCYFKGNSYNIGERINRTKTYCSLGCSCTRKDSDMAISCGGEINCANFGPPPPEGCYFSYSLEHCCGGDYCPPKDRPVYKCTYDGVEYKEGEKFFPKNSCSMCLCKKGFKGEIEEPFCIPRQCDGQIRHQDKIQKSCAPVYGREEDIQNGILCCPDSYTCPDGKEVIEGNPTSSLQCKYGDKTLKVGQGFKKENKDRFRTQKVACTCKIPPLLTCVVEK